MSLPQSVANELARQVARDVGAEVSQPSPTETELENGVYTIVRTRNTSSAYGCKIRFMNPDEKPRSVESELRHIVPDSD